MGQRKPVTDRTVDFDHLTAETAPVPLRLEQVRS